MEEFLYKDEAVLNLWLAYVKTPEFKTGPKGFQYAIPPHHPLVIKQEIMGIERVYQSLVDDLNNYRSRYKTLLFDRTVGDWLADWKSMHVNLWSHILKNCGDWRKKDVRFGDIGDEEIYHIPKWQDVPREVQILAQVIHKILHEEIEGNQEKFHNLAKIHYQFIRIHPFDDGNGRIARAVTDQLSIFYGFPPAMSGYPRHDSRRRESYHRAIKSCASDSTCHDLSIWIQGYIESQLKNLA